MPYIISQSIHEELTPMWGESSVFSRKNLFSIEEGKLPPVHYDSFEINSHSITHIEAQKHVVKDGRSISDFFNQPEKLYGPTVVIKLVGNGYKARSNGIFLWIVSKEELLENLQRVLDGKELPKKVLLTSEFCPQSKFGYHDPNYVLILSEEAANWLIDSDVNLYGTTWKSSDYMPGSSERPIHKILLKNAAILENIELKHVPEGIYFLNAFPLKIEGASESPCCPVLFDKDDIF